MTVLLVPADGVLQALAEWYPRGEAHAPEPRVVQRVAPVMPLTVPDVSHHAPVRAAVCEQCLGQLYISQFRIAIDVVYALRFPAFEDQMDATAVVIYMDPAADVLAVPV
jgi:hypothetical protein